MTDKSVSDLRIKILSALSDPTRLELLEYLSEGERCVCEILPAFQRSQSTISKHLNILYEADILERKIDGKRTLYRIKDPQVFDLIRLVDSMALRQISAAGRGGKDSREIIEQREMILTVTYTIMAALQAGLSTLMEYLSAHVLTCLIPAFFIAGGIAALLKTEMVLKYFGADAPKWICYSVAATSGTILAVCSCTILPMFAGIEKKGAGIGPATAFLFSGPAINLLAIVLTARVLGLDLGIARAVAAVSMAVIIGLIMAAIFERNRKCKISSNNAPAQATMETTEPQESGRTERISILFLGLLIGVLLSATSKLEFALKWTIVAAFVAAAAYVLIRYFSSDEKSAFFSETWSLTKKIFPLLVIGTFITGIIGYFMPTELLRTYLGSNSFLSCFTASIIGALLYMPTLLEVPIVGTLFGYSSGITAAGPALSLLLAGPSLSLPSMIVITRIIGLKKGGVYFSLVVIASTLMGMLYGAIVS